MTVPSDRPTRPQKLSLRIVPSTPTSHPASRRRKPLAQKPVRPEGSSTWHLHLSDQAAPAGPVATTVRWPKPGTYARP